MKMIDITQVSWQNKAHFIGVAANQMRRILVDHARNHNAQKRGGEFQILTLNEEIDKSDEESTDLIALDDALNELAKMDPSKQRSSNPPPLRRPINHRNRRGLGVSPITIKRHWKLTKAWLYGQLSGQ